MSKKKVRQTPSTTVKPAAATQNPTFKRTITTGSTDFNPDHSDVIKDLRRIGILAGSFFVVLIVLSFFLN